MHSRRDLPVLRAPYHHYGLLPQLPKEATAELAALAKRLETSDGFVVVDGEYNLGPTPGIINLLDHFHYPQYKYKVHYRHRGPAAPIAIVHAAGSPLHCPLS